MAYPDRFASGDPPGLDTNGPGRAIVAVTPSDSADLTYGECRAFHVNVAGDVRFTDGRGNTVTLTVTAGAPIPYSARRIWSTGTTASGIHAVY